MPVLRLFTCFGLFSEKTLKDYWKMFNTIISMLLPLTHKYMYKRLNTGVQT